MDTHRIIKVGNCSVGNSEGGVVLSPEGIFSTVTAGTHGYGFSNIIEVKDERFQMFKISEDRICKENS